MAFEVQKVIMRLGRCAQEYERIKRGSNDSVPSHSFGEWSSSGAKMCQQSLRVNALIGPGRDLRGRSTIMPSN